MKENFYVLQTHSYVLIRTMLWWKRGTVVIVNLKVSQTPIVGPIRSRMNPGTFPARKAECVYCSDKAITFFGSAYPLLRVDINIDLVQIRYRGDRHPRSFLNSHCRPHTEAYEPGYFSGP